MAKASSSAGTRAGKQRKKLGFTTAPVHVAHDLTPKQIRAYRIADNKLHELSTWDFELLPLELTELQALDVDLSLLGFDEDELARILDGGLRDGLLDPDDVLAPPAEAITQLGDVWILGDHRLLCGDSASSADVDRLLNGASIHLVNTDPPYNVKVEPRSNNAIAAGLSSFQATAAARRGRGMTHHQGFDVERHPEKAKATHRQLRAKDRPLANDFVSDAAFDQLLEAWFGNIARVLRPGRGFYILGGVRELRQLPARLEGLWAVLQPSNHLGQAAPCERRLKTAAPGG